jgi:hypothetical protein
VAAMLHERQTLQRREELKEAITAGVNTQQGECQGAKATKDTDTRGPSCCSCIPTGRDVRSQQ